MAHINLKGMIAVLRDIFQQSKTLSGRFFCLKSASVNINSSNFGTLVLDALGGVVEEDKYPSALLLPPFKTKPNNNKGWATYKVQLIFAVVDKRNGNKEIKNADPETNLSLQSFTDDWNDTGIIADDFLKAFHDYCTVGGLFNLIAEDKDTRQYRYFAGVGNDGLNGCHLSFDLKLWEGDNCNALPDYPNTMTVNVTDFSPNTLNKQ